MTYKGTVRNGGVVLEAGISLPEGTEVRIGVPDVGNRDVERLLAEPSFDRALEKFHLLYKIHRGIEQADAGQTVSHEEARERLQKWLA